MKKIILILLILIVCVSIVATDVVLAKAKLEFGGWDWFQSLPPWDSQNWIVDEDHSKELLANVGGKPIFLMPGIFFEDSKTGQKASLLFYSGGTGLFKLGKYDIVESQFAIVAFPPKKDNTGRRTIIVITTYKIEKGKATFFASWVIPWEDSQDYFPIISTKIFSECVRNYVPVEKLKFKNLSEENINKLPVHRLELRFREGKDPWISFGFGLVR